MKTTPFVTLTLMLSLVGSLALGCSKDEDTADTSETDADADSDADTDGDADADTDADSDFTAGQYRIDEMVIEDDSTVGFDFDGDTTIDNQLPQVLSVFAPLIPDIDVSVEGFNTTIASALEDGTLVLLAEASQEESVLTYDLLLGAIDDKGAVYVDEAQSYDDEGAPYGRMVGAFTSATDYATGPDDIQVPITFFPGEPALMIPMQAALSAGTLDTSTNVALVGGVIPVSTLVEQVVVPVLEGSGYSSDQIKEYTDLIYSVLDQETMSDIEFEDGSRGISAAINVTAATSSF